MNKNDIVMVYGKPLTSELPEGRAKLIKRITSVREHSDLQNWQIKFLSDEFITERLIRSYEPLDLFDTYTSDPSSLNPKLRAVLDSYSDHEQTYQSCSNILVEVLEIGYTFEYGLDAEPHNLRKL